MTTSDDERAWVERARRDPEAFRYLYERYFPRIYAYACYRSRSVQDAEDLVSETFLRAMDGFDGFAWRHEGSVAAWLFRIAHNVVSNHHRRGMPRERMMPLDDLPEIEAGEPLPDEMFARKELFAHLSWLVGTLPPRQRDVVSLRFFGELRNREIARVLELDERTVASHLSRGLDQLHREFAKDSVRARRTREVPGE